MDLEKIEQDFAEMIQQRGIHKKLEVESHNVRAYRQYLKNGTPISLQLKMKLLQKAGYLVSSEEKEFTRKDLQDLIKWYNDQGLTYEPDYAVHKYLLHKRSRPAAKS